MPQGSLNNFNTHFPLPLILINYSLSSASYRKGVMKITLDREIASKFAWSFSIKIVL